MSLDFWQWILRYGFFDTKRMSNSNNNNNRETDKLDFKIKPFGHQDIIQKMTGQPAELKIFETHIFKCLASRIYKELFQQKGKQLNLKMNRELQYYLP